MGLQPCQLLYVFCETNCRDCEALEPGLPHLIRVFMSFTTLGFRSPSKVLPAVNFLPLAFTSLVSIPTIFNVLY